MYGFPSFHQRYVCGIIYHQTFVHWVWIPSRTECQLHSSNDCSVLILSINMHFCYCNIVLSVFAPRDNTITPYSAIFPKGSAVHYIWKKKKKNATAPIKVWFSRYFEKYKSKLVASKWPVMCIESVISPGRTKTRFHYHSMPTSLILLFCLFAIQYILCISFILHWWLVS